MLKSFSWKVTDEYWETDPKIHTKEEKSKNIPEQCLRRKEMEDTLPGIYSNGTEVEDEQEKMY